EYTRALLDAAPSMTSADIGSRRAALVGQAAPGALRDCSGTTVVSAPLVTVRGLVKTYPWRGTDGGVTAVDGVSLDLARGRTTALVGESGSGKTTTARMIARLVAPTSGTVEFDGVDVTAAS